MSTFSHSVDQASCNNWVSKAAPQPQDPDASTVIWWSAEGDMMGYSRKLTPFQLDIKRYCHRRSEWKSLVRWIKCDKCLSRHSWYKCSSGFHHFVVAQPGTISYTLWPFSCWVRLLPGNVFCANYHLEGMPPCAVCPEWSLVRPDSILAL